MAVRIRLKQMGRRHRMYYRICVMDSRVPRGGRSIEDVGTYDPMIRDTDKRVTMKAERIDYWISVGAKPTENVARLIEKYKGNVPDVRIDESKLPKVEPRVMAPVTKQGSTPDAVHAGDEETPAKPEEPAAPPSEEKP